MTDLSKRLITGTLGIIAIVILLMVGMSAIRIAIFLCTLEILLELHKAFLKIKIKINLPILFIGALITFLCSYFHYNLIFALALFFLLNGFGSIILKKYRNSDMIYTIFAYFYGVFLLSLLASINEIYIFVSALIISFSTDTFAYLTGNIFGRHKLIERISPHKSVEGAIGGTILATIFTFLYFYFIKRAYVNIDLNYYIVILIVFASISGQFGDLFASKIKRTVNIKDFGKILPGHGGFLDRFDSLIFVSPFVYFLYYLIV